MTNATGGKRDWITSIVDEMECWEVMNESHEDPEAKGVCLWMTFTTTDGSKLCHETDLLIVGVVDLFLAIVWRTEQPSKFVHRRLFLWRDTSVVDENCGKKVGK